MSPTEVCVFQGCACWFGKPLTHVFCANFSRDTPLNFPHFVSGSKKNELLCRVTTTWKAIKHRRRLPEEKKCRIKLECTVTAAQLCLEAMKKEPRVCMS